MKSGNHGPLLLCTHSRWLAVAMWLRPSSPSQKRRVEHKQPITKSYKLVKRGEFHKGLRTKGNQVGCTRAQIGVLQLLFLPVGGARSLFYHGLSI